MSDSFIPSSPPSTASVHLPERPEPLLSLTRRQESRLRHHLDDRLLQLERDERKHAFGTLKSLLQRLDPILQLILQIPPFQPWADLRVSYFLTFTGSVTSYITSLPLIPTLTDLDLLEMDPTTYEGDDLNQNHERQRNRTGNEDQDQDQDGKRKSTAQIITSQLASQTLHNLLSLLSQIQTAWLCILSGSAWLPPPFPGGQGQVVPVEYGASVGATERIRLRSIVLAGRERMIAWSRVYGRFDGVTFRYGGEERDMQVVPGKSRERDGHGKSGNDGVKNEDVGGGSGRLVGGVLGQSTWVGMRESEERSGNTK